MPAGDILHFAQAFLLELGIAHCQYFIDDEYLEITRDFTYLVGRRADDVFNGVFVVVSGEECCERNPFHSLRAGVRPVSSY